MLLRRGLQSPTRHLQLASQSRRSQVHQSLLLHRGLQYQTRTLQLAGQSRRSQVPQSLLVHRGLQCQTRHHIGRNASRGGGESKVVAVALIKNIRYHNSIPP